MEKLWRLSLNNSHYPLSAWSNWVAIAPSLKSGLLLQKWKLSGLGAPSSLCCMWPEPVLDKAQRLKGHCVQAPRLWSHCEPQDCDHTVSPKTDHTVSPKTVITLWAPRLWSHCEPQDCVITLWAPRLCHLLKKTLFSHAVDQPPAHIPLISNNKSKSCL